MATNRKTPLRLLACSLLYASATLRCTLKQETGKRFTRGQYMRYSGGSSLWCVKISMNVKTSASVNNALFLKKIVINFVFWRNRTIIQGLSEKEKKNIKVIKCFAYYTILSKQRCCISFLILFFLVMKFSSSLFKYVNIHSSMESAFGFLKIIDKNVHALNKFEYFSITQIH